MQVEQHVGFLETRGQFVFWTGLVYGAARVRQELTALIVEGNHHAPVQQTRAGIIADTEVSSRVRIDATLFQIGMSAIDGVKRKP